MRNIKETNISNRTYYFSNEMINIENFDSDLLKIDKNSYKVIYIYYIGYVTIKDIDDYESIQRVNPLYLIIDEVNRYIEENNRNQYLFSTSTNKNKEILEMYTEIRGGIKIWLNAIPLKK